jgi:hypothetical protein
MFMRESTAGSPYGVAGVHAVALGCLAGNAASSSRALRHVSAPSMDRDDQAALAQQYRGASHGVVGHPQVAG